MGKKLETSHICVLKTGKLYEHDMAANALKEKKIPFFKQLETSGGIRLAMPFQPSMGPGTFYNILVPEKYFDKARRILNELPIEITDNPDVFHFGASKEARQGWKIFAWGLLICFVLSFIAIIVSYFKG